MKDIVQLTFNNGSPNTVDGKPVVNVNVFTPEDLFVRLGRHMEKREGFSVATINLDHIVKMRTSQAFRDAYKAQDIIVADGFPIVWIGRMLGANLRRTTGADVMLPLIEIAMRYGRSIAVVGTPDHVLGPIVDKMKDLYPGLVVSYAKASSPAFDPESDAATALLKEIENSGAALCFLAYGAPKQEVLAARGKQFAPHVGFLSVGGALDILIGRQKRAPVWMQRANLEWFWRLVQKPSLRFKRYLACACVFPLLIAESCIRKGQA